MDHRSRFAGLTTLLALAVPMVLARMSQSVITFADAIQVKDLGPGAIAATATGGLNVLVIVMLPSGIVMIVQSFVAQLVGSARSAEAPRYAWYGLAIALASGLLGLAMIPAVSPILGEFGYSKVVHDSMASYMHIRLLSTAAIVGTEALNGYYAGFGRTWMQMIAGMITMVVAVVLNWVLIGGHLGAPALGVDGAAVASAIASWLGFGFLAIAFWFGRTRMVGRLQFGELRRMLRFGLPNGLNWFLEFSAFQLFVNVVIAGLGDQTLAALNIVIAINSTAFMPAFGMASAGAILAAQAIGRGDRDAVWPQVRLTLGCTIGWMVAIAAVYLTIPDRVLGWFSPDTPAAVELVAVGGTMLVTSALWQVFDATAMTLYETLRAAGDTAWPAVARIVIAWGVFAPAAYLVVRVEHGGPVGAMMCLVGYLALLAGAMAWRFRTGVWRRIELIEPRLV